MIDTSLYFDEKYKYISELENIQVLYSDIATKNLRFASKHDPTIIIIGKKSCMIITGILFEKTKIIIVTFKIETMPIFSIVIHHILHYVSTFWSSSTIYVC